MAHVTLFLFFIFKLDDANIICINQEGKLNAPPIHLQKHTHTDSAQSFHFNIWAWDPDISVHTLASNLFDKTQTHERLKRILFIMTKHDMHIFCGKLPNNT